MKTTLSLLLFATLSSVAAAQSLPLVWNRSQDWVAKQNPCKDSSGNAVWYHSHRMGCCKGGLANTWHTKWGGWVFNHSSAYYKGADPILKDSMVDFNRADLFTRYDDIAPQVDFRNTTKQSFMLSIEGNLSLYWSGPGNVAFNTPVVVEISGQ